MYFQLSKVLCDINVLSVAINVNLMIFDIFVFTNL